MLMKPQNAFPRMILAATLLPMALAGCATTGSVKRAQATADQALARANEAGESAQHAQSSADGAMAAAQHAQGTADGAATSAQGANGTAQQALTAGQGNDARINALEERLHHLERERAMHKGKKKHHRGHHKVATACPTTPKHSG